MTQRPSPAVVPDTPVTVLMYHAVLDARADATGSDPHYAVADGAFRAQLAEMAARGLQAASVRDILRDGLGHARIALTFDDGHGSNLAAAEAIALAGGSADFFVNPEHVGRRGFLDWAALRDMAAAGHSIQSHGQTHRYMDELPDDEIESELRRSRAEIEDHLGSAVTLFAPPGGRLRPSVARIAERLGYQAICSSRSALWRPGASAWNVPRLAVLASTSAAQFSRWLSQDAWELARLRLRHGVLQGSKRLLGNAGYERVRRRLLGARTNAGVIE
jgi:peptidoglycan/xylan/chitin deacetylase (PgdA/CDA1 family)